ncbi:MAG: aldo/keto reductase [Proteobacteria bacterium]|nr:aldo/keto reductase [Pseudomonadota bacterium]
MDFSEKRELGRTGLLVGPLGMSAAYDPPAGALEEAFERGCNYFYWGAVRRGGMKTAIKNLCGRGRRDEMVIAIQSFSRWPWPTEASFHRALKALGIERADVLLFGWFNSEPGKRMLDLGRKLKEKGLVRSLGITGHNRKLFPELAKKRDIDVFHVRYNAVHPGAEQDVFPLLPEGPDRPGVVAFTALCWGHLLNPKKTRPLAPATAPDCYRFCMSQPGVDVCMTGPANAAQVAESLRALDLGPLSGEEMARMRELGKHLYGKVGRIW